MTVNDLIERLEEYRDEYGDLEVRLMTQQNWPFEYTVTGLASAPAASAERAVIWISISVARNDSAPSARSMSTLDRIGSVWRRSMMPLTAESGPRSSSRFALTRAILLP